MRLPATLISLACLLSATTSFAAPHDQGATDAERTFIKEAAESSLAEIKIGQLAQKKATNKEVKDFGQKLVTDHSQANAKLKKIAAAKNVALPKDVSPAAREHYKMLERLSGAAFDKSFTEHMVKDHEDGISAFEKEASSGEDDQLKNFASSTLPKLREHLKIAEQLQGNT